MSGDLEQSANPIHVGQDESLPEVLDRLHGHRGESLTLVIPEHSPILLTATEFRALKELAKRQNIRLGLDTTDPLRVQLATMFGLAEKAPRTDTVEPEAPSYGANFGTWRNARRPKQRDAGVPPPTVDASPAQDHSETSDDPIAVSRRRRNELYRDSAARETTASESSYIDDAGIDYLPDDEQHTEHSRAWLYGRIAAVLLVLVAIGLAALWYWFPTVQVDVALRTASVSTDVMYSVAASDAEVPNDSAFVVEAREETADVPFTIEIPASGVAREPDGTATGPIILRNVGDAPVTLDTGTELSGVDDIAYTLNDSVEVPAGSVEVPGEAEAQVSAAEAGRTGNREPGALTGKLPDAQVYYSNLNGAIEGGSDREFPVVTEADRTEAERAVRDDLRQAAVDGWEDQLPDGMAVVGPSVEPGDPDFTIEGDVDERRDNVTVSGNVPVTGLIYDIGEVEQQARDTFEGVLQDQAPPGYMLDADTITLGEPELVAASPTNIEYRVGANGTAQAVFDDGARDGLKNRISGSSPQEAEAAVESVGAIETWNISTAPEWWPDRMPQSSDRVTIDVIPSDSEATQAGSPESTPEDSQ